MSRIAKLPAGYRQVEYIESSGTQYIDTGFKPNQNTKIEVGAATRETHFFLGAIDGSLRTALFILKEGSIHYAYGASGYATTTITGLTYPAVITLENGKITASDKVYNFAVQANHQMNYSIALFAQNSNGQAVVQGGVCYYCKIYDRDNLIRDYIPCINPSGEAGLYDLVYGVFYGNAGSGVFAVGRNVYSEDEITKLEYVESTGAQYVDTEFKPNQDTRIALDAQYTVGAKAEFMFGVRTTDYKVGYSVLITSGGIRSDYGNSLVADASLALTERYAIDKNKNICAFGSTKITNAASTFQSTFNLFLFACDEGGTAKYFGKVRMYSCQLYDNGTLIREYHPVTVNGEVGLWDACSGVLYTSASGTALIAGPEIISIAPPKNLTAVITEAGVVLTWDAEEKALGYKVYRDETNIAYTTESSYTDGTAKPDNNYIYGVSAYNADTETEATEIMVFVESPYSPLELITDRTQKALDRVIELAGKDYMTEMSAEEQEEWRDGMKGAYNASDMNRVGKAVDALAKLLRELVPALKKYAAENQIGWDTFYAPPFDPSEMHPATKRDWTVRDIPTPADMELYLSNIKLLRSALAYNTDALPATMENLTWSGANAIEKALFALDGAIIVFSADIRMMIDKAVAARFYSDEIYSGEV